MKVNELKGELKGELIGKLSVYYHAEYYSWADLCLQIQQAISSDKIKPSGALTIPAQDVFSAVLYLLYGFIEKRTLFPASSKVDEFNSSSAALAIATSGSQASPKIALISRQNIISHCQNFVKLIPIEHSSIWLNCMPLNHIAGVMIIYRCWFNNAGMILHDNFNVQKVWQDINHYAVSHISLVPRMLFKLLEFSQDSKPPTSLKYLIVGGDKLADSLHQRATSAGWPVYISYGMTEASSTIALGRTQDKLKILDGITAQLTEQGVLKIKGDMIFSGYSHLQEKQSDKHWFVTHDRVKLQNNHLSIIGRDDYMIISGGKNISPEYIESLLEKECVSGSFAIGKITNSSYSDNNDQLQDNDLNQSWGDTIIALFCVGEDQLFGGIDDLKQRLKKTIPPACQPGVILSVKKIPRNSLGKIDRKAVQIIINKRYK